MFTRRAIRIGVAACVPALVAAASVAASAHPRPQAGAAFACEGGFHQVSSPSSGTGTGTNVLYGVTAISPTDAWAVGYRATTTTDKTLILHWNGSKWVKVASPNAGGTNRLYGVAAVSATDVWAVGYHMGTTLNSVNRTLTEHWDGATWTVVPSPNAKVGKHASPNQLNGVTVSGTNVLAAGYTTDIGNTGSQTLLVGNPGSGWSILGSANTGDASSFFGIDAPPSGPVWEVGRSMTSGNTPDTVPLIARGTSISVGPAVTGVSTLGDVEALSSTDAWAVGFQLDSMSNDTALIAHYNGSNWAAVASAPSAYPVTERCLGRLGDGRVRGRPRQPRVHRPVCRALERLVMVGHRGHRPRHDQLPVERRHPADGRRVGGRTDAQRHLPHADRARLRSLTTSGAHAQNDRQTLSNTSTQVSSDARSTHSSAVCSPAPTGPYTTHGMPASTSTPESIQP